MTVVKAMFLDEAYDGKEPKQLAEKISSTVKTASRAMALAAKSLNINSTACEITDKEGKTFMQGSKTEIAILNFFTEMGYPYQKDRQKVETLNVVPFSSAAKRMSYKIAEPADQSLFEALGIDPPEKNGDGKFPFIFVKGASEIVLKTCNRIMTNTGKIVPLTEEKKAEYERCIGQYADESLRTICCGIKPVYSASDESEDMNDTRDLVLVGIFGILDPLRPEVPAAISHCKDAGIVVRMVTGDNLATAKAIARGCGILDNDGIVMEGPDFRKLTESEFDKVLPKLQVLARSSPLDKQILVRNLKRLGETVAVTGGNLDKVASNS
jgi:Ca2+-transporting ATPase